MPRECQCAGGSCKPAIELSRRQFVAMLGAGTVTVSAKPEETEAQRFAMPEAPLRKWKADLLSPGKPRIYDSATHADARLHLGGIGTGNFEIGADGQMTTWQLFNTLRDGSVPFCFAVRAGKTARLLQTSGGPEWPRVKRIEMRGEYPFAFLRFLDASLPVSVELEAFSPFAPLETRLSSMPVAIFVFKLRNPTASPQQVSLAAFMQNPVGYEALGDPSGNRHDQYGSNVNLVRKEGSATVLSMSAKAGKPPTVDRPVRIYTNLDVGALNSPYNDRPGQLTVAGINAIGPEPASGAAMLVWLEDAPADLPAAALLRAAEAVRKGATLVLSGADVPLLKAYGYATQGRPLTQSSIRPTIVFEDFEGAYDNWTAQGAAFGARPVQGTLPNQQRVSGFAGRGLVNSYLDGDSATGRLVSKPFTVQRKYIRFLVGGGSSNETQVRLVVDGKVVRTATGRNDERLLPASWDVAEFEGREAHIHIVDEATGGWGHINVDQIEFSDLPGDTETLKALDDLMPIRFSEVRTESPDPLTGLAPTTYSPLELRDGARRETLADGTAAVSKDLGKGKIVLVMASVLPPGRAGIVSRRQRAYQRLCALCGARYTAPDGLHPGAPGLGALELTAMTPKATALRGFTDWSAAWSRFVGAGRFDPAPAGPSQPTPMGETVNGAVAATITLGPGQSVEVPFALTWRYPNKYTRQGATLGNHYAREWPSVASVTRETCTRLASLRKTTELFRKTFYDSSLPYWFLDCMTANAAIIRHVGVVFRLANGDIFGWEGSNGCCQPTCTHVWGYEQTLSHLFPDLAKDMRRIDYKHQQRPDGGVNNRTEVPSPPHPTGEQPFADGHASCVLKAYREALRSGDEAWLRSYWPHIRKAVQYLIDRDAATSGGSPNGTLEDDQWNTYDEALHGVTTFISGYYLAALRAGEEWAKRVGDAETARRFREVFEKGRARLVEVCWDGEYFRQELPGYERMPGEVGPGCMADQLIGQWWAHQLGLGYILPEDKVKSALRAVFRHNWMSDLTGWKHSPRAFAGDKDKGLMIVTWPKGGRPPHVMLYSDEVWTGIEYQVAAHLIYEGMVEEGLAIVKGARDRYDGVPRPPLPRNPWNEIECGGHYARAMSSWSLLLAASGFEYDGPAKSLRIAPRVTHEDFRSFFCGPSGWGTLAQHRRRTIQEDTIRVAHGGVAIATLTLVAPGTGTTAAVTLAGRPVPARASRDGDRVTVTLSRPVTVAAGQQLTVTLT